MRYKDPEVRRRWITQSRLILLALVLVAFVMAAYGGLEDGQFDLRGFFSNLATELLGAVITFFILERIVAANVDNSALKERLIRRLENPDNGITWDAISELRANGWLQDGSMYGWFLKRANLSGADLRGGNFNGLGLYRCDLTGAKIDEEQLVAMNDLRRTLMPDGQVYDGRYCLPGDITWARTHYGVDFNEATTQKMADYYEVPLERYLSGQQWARANLEKFEVTMPDYLRRMVFD